MGTIGYMVQSKDPNVGLRYLVHCPIDLKPVAPGVFQAPIGPPTATAFVEDRLVTVRLPVHNAHTGEFIRYETTQYPSSLVVGMIAQLNSEGASPRDRELAEVFLRALHPYPVPQQRRPMIAEAARERAQAQEKSITQVLSDALRSAFYMTSGTSSPDRSFEKTLRQELSQHMTTDFLGPGWREGDTVDVEQVADAIAAGDDSESPLDPRAERVLRALDRGGLSDQEKSLLALIRDRVAKATKADERGLKRVRRAAVQEWADGQGLAHSEAKKIYRNARAKLNSSLDSPDT